MKFNMNRIFDGSMAAVLLIVFFFLVVLVAAVFLYTGFEDIVSALLSKETFFAIKLSLLTATIATVFSIIIAIPTAYALSKFNFRGKDIINAALNLPIVLPPVAIGAFLLIFFMTSIGSVVETFVQFTYAVPGIILAQLLIITALAIRVIKPAFDALDPEYEQVARTLGYNKLQTFFRVTLPMCKNAVMVAGILAWARAIGEFGATVMLAGATRMKTETLPIAIFLSLARADVTRVIALILILLCISVSMLYAMQKLTGDCRL